MPIAIGLLIEDGQVNIKRKEQFAFFGELSLNAMIRCCNGILPIVEGFVRLLGNGPTADDGVDGGSEGVVHRVFNIGNNNPEKLMVFIGALEKAVKHWAER